MTSIKPKEHFTLSPESNQNLYCISGYMDCNLRALEKLCGVSIHNRGHEFYIFGGRKDSAAVRTLLEYFYQHKGDEPLTAMDYQRYLGKSDVSTKHSDIDERAIETPLKKIILQNSSQITYAALMQSSVLTIATGCAGTGKTHLAVAMAVRELCAGKVKRIVLVRPTVEAGEKLGYLPGDISDKVHPYLLPVYDVLNEVLGATRVRDFEQDDSIEIAPLAYMRGRTLKDAFIILDEAQNTTRTQMKMFLTRLGLGSKMVVTGDESQMDVPREQSGLTDAQSKLSDLIDKRLVGLIQFRRHEVMRHNFVSKILEAYDKR